jgi:hypothetical protein
MRWASFFYSPTHPNNRMQGHMSPKNLTGNAPRKRRAVQRNPILHERDLVDPLIVPRRVATQLLSVSVATLLRLEAQGRLRPIKLGTTESSQTFYAMRAGR